MRNQRVRLVNCKCGRKIGISSAGAFTKSPSIQSSCQRQAKSQISQDEEEYSTSNPGRRKIVDMFQILDQDQTSSDEILVKIKSQKYEINSTRSIKPLCVKSSEIVRQKNIKSVKCEKGDTAYLVKRDHGPGLKSTQIGQKWSKVDACFSFNKPTKEDCLHFQRCI